MSVFLVLCRRGRKGKKKKDELEVEDEGRTVLDKDVGVADLAELLGETARRFQDTVFNALGTGEDVLVSDGKNGLRSRRTRGGRRRNV